MISSSDVYGSSYLWPWSTSAQKILDLSIPASTDRTAMWVFSAIEGSPQNNPNSSCGGGSATQTAEIVSDWPGDLNTITGTIPASSGMGHLVLAPQAYDTTSVNEAQHLQLWVKANYSGTTYTGGCCGDAKIGFVRMNGTSADAGSGAPLAKTNGTTSGGASNIASVLPALQSILQTVSTLLGRSW